MTWGWLIPIVIVFTIFGLPVLTRHADRRRQFLLDLKKEERLIAEAKARELELEHKRRELEYREALLELERFDRRSGTKPPGTKPPGTKPPGTGAAGPGRPGGGPERDEAEPS
jgi:hypothetical protein